ncbi:tRNA-dihydrouridine synthase C [Salmonella enterica subsp. enterica]|nr:tRNA-dihydrouridine synthase C [Salmonella enterica subsp. enterica]
MRVLLAPMEGVLDALVRELLTEVNDYDLCITEFVRVVDQLLPVKVFHRICPELHHASRTPSGTPVRIQLLASIRSGWRKTPRGRRRWDRMAWT